MRFHDSPPVIKSKKLSTKLFRLCSDESIISHRMILNRYSLFCVYLYSKYEVLFVRMSFKEAKDKKIQRRHRWLVIKVCKLSVHKVTLFQKKYWCKMYSRMSVAEFENLIKEFRSECNNER